MQSKRTCQPPDWWKLFQAEADAAGVSLSSWMGTACLDYVAIQSRLGRLKVAKLSDRPLASRPPKNGGVK